MRPIQLAIEGLRSFRSPAASIDFTGRDHIAIVGDTGAGKSSILEAITYTLYGETTFTAQANQELMNDTSTTLRVVLRFQVFGEEWEVARTLKKAGDGKVGGARVQLRRVDEDGGTIEQIEQVKPVNERIKALLGLDSDAFLRTVVLPQGRFARLLVEDKPSERSNILRQVWRTDELVAAGLAAGAARQDAAKLCVQLQQEASAYPADLAGHLARLEDAHDAAVHHEAAASEAEGAASRSLEIVRVMEKAQRAASDVVERLRVLEIDRPAERLAPIGTIDRRIADEDAVLEQCQAGIEQELARIPSDDGPTSEDVAAALTTLRSIGGLVTAAEETADTLRGSVEDASRKHAEARRLEESAADARQQATEHAAQRPPLADAGEAARARRAAVDQEYSRYEERGAELDDKRQQLGALRQSLHALAERLQSAQHRGLRAERTAAEADEHLAAARRSESAAAAAHGLHPGDECPICHRDLAADWEAPDDTGVREAQQLAEAARQAARQAERGATALHTQKAEVERQSADTAAQLGAAETKLADVLRELAQHVDLDAGAPVPPRDALLAPLAAAGARSAALLAAHDSAHEALREEASRRDTEASVARRAAGSADTLAAHTRAAAEAALSRLHGAVQRVPAEYRPGLDLPADVADLHKVNTSPLRAQAQSAQARQELLAVRTAERERLRKDLDAAARARAVLARRRADEIDGPLDEVLRDLNRHRDVIVEAIRHLTLGRDVPPAVSTREVEALAAWIDELGAATADVSRAANERARAAAAAGDAARAELAAIGTRLGADTDAGNLDAIVDYARGKANDARFEMRSKRQSAVDFAAIIDDVQHLRALLAEVQDKERALGDLEDALKPGAFLKWLTLRRSRRLLVYASRMLEEMSGGKYSFVDPGETEEQWRVLDRDSNQPRTPASLSGGEQFIASLSLALGMVEMMARSGGRLESLFLDEGFGSLDRNNLDAAVHALGTVAARGRLVAVISHVRAVAEQIDHVLAVTRVAAGSRTEWLTSRQRQRLSESDTGWEATSALAGLLD